MICNVKSDGCERKRWKILCLLFEFKKKGKKNCDFISVGKKKSYSSKMAQTFLVIDGDPFFFFFFFFFQKIPKVPKVKKVKIPSEKKERKKSDKEKKPRKSSRYVYCQM